MKTYINFMSESIKPTLKYYAFDVDDNLLFMDTKIIMEHLENDEWVRKEISTSEFAIARKKPDEWRTLDNDESFLHFIDFGPRGNKGYLIDTKQAILNKKFGPSWKAFINCLINGSLFIIITARGHEPETIRSMVEYIIYDYLTQEQRNEMISNLISFKSFFSPHYDIFQQVSPNTLIKKYLDLCDFIGVSAPSFIEKYGIGEAVRPEQAKILAMKNFIRKIEKYKDKYDINVKIGFSDDDVNNINSIKKYFSENSSINDIAIVLFDTSNPDTIKKIQL